ncbi:efflux RND transporter periplasmic adaptor subunit [Singulisphaera sp. PoT]|uniref:efflux RND transporter periplasmic adaptor subunit n=1 Tax=Singulisphaera sp. PoT TaxID=3411797 RepID=UPI003BF517D2
MSTHVEPRPQPSPTGSHKRSGLWIPLLIAAIVAAGFYWRNRASSPSAETNASPSATEANSAPDAVRVEVVTPQRGGLTRTSTQIGSVHAFEHADLYAKVSGYLKTQEVDIGSRVKKGQVLATIDDPEVVKDADRAAAALEQAKTVVMQAQARIETAQADEQAEIAAVSKAEADVAGFVAKRKYRQKELTRYRELLTRQAVPQQIVDEYEDNYDSALADERSAEAAVASAKAQLNAARARIDQAKADLAQSKASVDVNTETLARDRVLVDYTSIKSPYDGVVTDRVYHIGAFIRSAAEGGTDQPLLKVARTDKMRVVTYVPDRDVPFTDVGDKAIITLDALPDQKFEGTVSRFSYTEVSESRTMRTEVDLENPKGTLREGMYGIATIILEQDTSSLTIPTGALTTKSIGGTATVFVVRDGRAKEVPVTTGTDSGIRVEILKGLKVEDQVITSRSGVADGVAVTIGTSKAG